MSEADLMRLDEAAEIVGCSTEALRARLRRYKLRVQRVNARRVFIRKEDVLAHVREMRPR